MFLQSVYAGVEISRQKRDSMMIISIILTDSESSGKQLLSLSFPSPGVVRYEVWGEYENKTRRKKEVFLRALAPSLVNFDMRY